MRSQIIIGGKIVCLADKSDKATIRTDDRRMGIAGSRNRSVSGSGRKLQRLPKRRQGCSHRARENPDQQSKIVERAHKIRDQDQRGKSRCMSPSPSVMGSELTVYTILAFEICCTRPSRRSRFPALLCKFVFQRNFGEWVLM